MVSFTPVHVRVTFEFAVCLDIHRRTGTSTVSTLVRPSRKRRAASSCCGVRAVRVIRDVADADLMTVLLYC